MGHLRLSDTATMNPVKGHGSFADKRCEAGAGMLEVATLSKSHSDCPFRPNITIAIGNPHLTHRCGSDIVKDTYMRITSTFRITTITGTITCLSPDACEFSEEIR